MIERYTRAEMGAIWDEEEKLRIWLEVELLACEALDPRKFAMLRPLSSCAPLMQRA